jgi:hypothetical protein
VTGSVRRDQEWHKQQIIEQSQRELIEYIRTQLSELKEKMHDELELSSFTKKKTPTAVLNYLITIVEKYLDFIPQQPALYAVLVQLRDDELMRCLLNMSIYIGTIDKPEVFIDELKKLYVHQDGIPHTQATMTMQQLPVLNQNMSKKDRKKMQAMIQQQQLLTSQPSQILLDGQNVSFSDIFILTK